MSQAIGGRKIFQLKTWATGLVVWPLNPLRSERSGQPHHIDNIPARVAVFPLALIGVVEVSIQGVTANLVVKTNTVVADTTGFRLC